VSLFGRRLRKFEYTTEARLKAAIEARLFPSPREIQRGLTKPRFARQWAEWSQRRISIVKCLVEKYGYCAVCAEGLLDYVTHVLQNSPVAKITKNEGVEWLWELYPTRETLVPPTDDTQGEDESPDADES
jgi:hypothetical protein